MNSERRKDTSGLPHETRSFRPLLPPSVRRAVGGKVSTTTKKREDCKKERRGLSRKEKKWSCFCLPRLVLSDGEEGVVGIFLRVSR